MCRSFVPRMKGQGWVLVVASLRGRAQEILHALTEHVPDQEISLRVAELVVAMTGIGQVFRLAHEIMRLDEAHVALELRLRL